MRGFKLVICVAERIAKTIMIYINVAEIFAKTILTNKAKRSICSIRIRRRNRGFGIADDKAHD
jgi:hypothetical protein